MWRSTMASIVRWRVAVLLLVACSCTTVSTAPSKTEDGKCLKDPSLGERFDFNIYYCNDEAKPNCCEVESEFTCCAEQATHVAQEQAILWGSLGGVITLGVLICVCYHKDSRCCDPGRDKGCCRCCNRRKDDKTPIVAQDEFFDPRMSDMKSAVDIHVHQPDDDSGRGSACSSPSATPHSDRRMSARSVQSVRSAGSQRSVRSPERPSSARSEKTSLSVTAGPSNMADIQL